MHPFPAEKKNHQKTKTKVKLQKLSLQHLAYICREYVKKWFQGKTLHYWHIDIGEVGGCHEKGVATSEEEVFEAIARLLNKGDWFNYVGLPDNTRRILPSDFMACEDEWMATEGDYRSYEVMLRQLAPFQIQDFWERPDPRIIRVQLVPAEDLDFEVKAKLKDKKK